MEGLEFFLSDSIDSSSRLRDIVVLTPDSWDDWFAYSTLYNVAYYDSDGSKKYIGAVKIGQYNMETDQRRPILPESFESLPKDGFFSVGQDVSYYESINECGDSFRHLILQALNDIAYDPNLLDKSLNENVTKISLLRSVSLTSIEGQFRRLAQGNAVLTPYQFKYFAPFHNKSSVGGMELEFNVVPNSTPQTNVHVVIGRNGVGKTHLFNNMIMALLEDGRNSKRGSFVNEMGNNHLFANLVFVSFSAFDETNPIAEKKDNTKQLKFSYIGLKRIGRDRTLRPPKSPVMLKNEFVKSVELCRRSFKNRRWLKALHLLEADPIFNEAEVSKIAELSVEVDSSEIASSIFNKLSSGHKIVLLTITRLVECVEERSLVLLDEPEAYLHPPLLSAFIRALSELLVERNAVAIIGTHSPVVLQEVPRSCVWKIRRHGVNAIAERLQIETFGENVGLLTQEIFGLELADSGFHKLLKDLAEESDSYEDAITKLNRQLGLEGKAILRNLMYIER